MKKKDRGEKKISEDTTSEVSRKYGQIAEKVVSRRTTEGEKRNENRETTLQRSSNGDRLGRRRATHVMWEQYLFESCSAQISRAVAPTLRLVS